ncbi:FeoA domain-containing protein [Desulfobotulus sp.]|uniref:FeoA domain-containing protein n=1 Tax=Desulfobotulus sp. TaxID=1940337 RepID=UPI002A36431A|nr:FeoA domain-containing protein [Desulfobotulus sp.]MDY0162740.1 FeoA domain-containing protein [Desulfobotulus sp.]
MKHIHDQEKRQLEKLFLQEGIDDIEGRLFVMDAFLDTESHPTFEELSAKVRSLRPDLNSLFVAETLDLMHRFGFARKLHLEGEPPRFEHHHIGQHHDHLICNRCGKIIEFEDADLEALQERIATRHGFILLQHRMELYGLCESCNLERTGTMTLAQARVGERLFIDAFLGGSLSRMRLLSMGLRVGDPIEVISGQGRGHVVVAVEGRRYSLGLGITEKILVRRKRPDMSCPVPGLITRNHCPHRFGEEEAEGRQVFLSAMKEGERGRIVKVGGCSMVRRRMLEMGMTPGSLVLVEKYLPLRNPVEVQVRGVPVSLRVSEARHILMEREDDGA